MQVPEEIPVIANITRSAPAVTQPETTAKQCLAYYGIGSVIQVAPEQAALFCSLKVSLRWHIDYEDGTDVYIFNTRPGIGKRKPRPITSNEKDGKLEEPRFIMKFPTLPGFWPLNAKNQDGKAHPGAGKGFAWCQALSFPGNGDKFTRKMYEGMKRYLEIMQLEFDGRNLKVTERKVIEPGEDWVTANGWIMMSPGLRSAIPDGDDLLLAVQATSKSTGRELTGVCRFRWDRSKWVPAFFTPVTSAGEPSVARHADGSLFFTARTRGGRRNNASGKVIDPWAATCGNSHPFFTEGESCEAIELWTATDADGPWTQNISLANQRSEAPLSVNATTDGIIFVLANPAGITSADGKVNWHQIKRARLALWQVAEDKRSFMPSRPRLIRDATEEFESVEKTAWLLDHPTSAVVRLADGRWHCLVTYRVSTLSYPAPEEAETFPLVMTAHHGCYVEEVITGQPAAPIWRFG